MVEEKAMTLIRMTLDGPVDLVKLTIERIKEHEPSRGYYVANSFGKDSGVVHRLMELAEVTFDAHHNFTTVDPPQLIRHGLKNYPDTEIVRPKISMWGLIIKKGFPPSRLVRYCCDYLKENSYGKKDRVVALGTRREESQKRANIQLIAKHKDQTRVTLFNPIFDWTMEDVWQFTHQQKIPYCELYNQGFCRLGCVMCPLSGDKQMEFEAQFFPKHYVAYLRMFDKMIKNRPDIAEKLNFTSPLDVMHWWMYRSHLSNDRTTQQILIADPKAAVV